MMPNRVIIELDDSTLCWVRALAKANGTTAPALIEYIVQQLGDYAGRNPNDAAKHVAVLLVRGGLDQLIPLLIRHSLKQADLLRKSAPVGKAIAP